MQFTSIYFACFFALVFIGYWLVFNRKTLLQNIFLLVAGYVFYGSWDYRFLLILVSVSLFNYGAGILIDSATRKRYRKIILIAGLTGNIGTLIIFKYYNFFIEGLRNLFKLFNLDFSPVFLGLIVPLGLSFYVFLSVSYLVDIYRRQVSAERNLLYVLLSLGYFPIILAGPIQRPASLIPQLRRKKEFDLALATDGMRQFLWGLFVKMVIADNLGVYVNTVFSGDFQGSTNFYGAILFAIQIYADFASYSDMAIGLSKILGIRLMRNFQFPYFAKDIGDFWKRWHISLTTWFRDYVFLPLAYFLSARIKKERYFFVSSELIIYTIALLFTWTLTGLWHGANVTFLAWGFIHAILLVIHHWVRKPKKALLSRYQMHHDLLYLSIQRIYTLFFIVAGWVFFRSPDMDAAFDFFDRTLKMSLFMPPKEFPTVMIIPVFAYFFVEWLQRDREHGLDFTGAPKTRFLRWSVYLTLVVIIFFYQVKQQDFIYFQF